MKLALRRGAPTNATVWQRMACWVIRARLVSVYCHGGIEIGGWLYHATAARGLHRLAPGEWSPERWDLIDMGEARDARALALFAEHEGAAYDWFSQLAFVGLRARDSRRFYCFEWCYLAMADALPRTRVVPETLLRMWFKE